MKPDDSTDDAKPVRARQRLNLSDDINAERLAFFGIEELPKESAPGRSRVPLRGATTAAPQAKLNLTKLFGAQLILAKALRTLCNRQNLDMPYEHEFQEALEVWKRGSRMIEKDLRLYGRNPNGGRSATPEMTIKITNGSFQRPAQWGKTKPGTREYVFAIDDRGLNSVVTLKLNQALIMDGITRYL